MRHFYFVTSYRISIELKLRRTLVQQEVYSTLSTPIRSFLYIDLLPPPSGDNEQHLFCINMVLFTSINRVIIIPRWRAITTQWEQERGVK